MTPKKAPKEKPPEAWSLRPGVWCSFYCEGGHGERYWSGGWHCGIVREVPIKGCHKNWVRIELMVDHYAVEETNGERVRRIMPHEKPWVFGANVNELGDTTYHGPRLEEIVAERAAEKEQQVADAAKRVKPQPLRKAKTSAASKPVKTLPTKTAKATRQKVRGRGPIGSASSGASRSTKPSVIGAPCASTSRR